MTSYLCFVLGVVEYSLLYTRFEFNVIVVEQSVKIDSFEDILGEYFRNLHVELPASIQPDETVHADEKDVFAEVSTRSHLIS